MICPNTYPDWCSGSITSVANPSHESTKNHVVHAVSGGLHDDPNGHDDCENDEHLLPPELLTHSCALSVDDPLG